MPDPSGRNLGAARSFGKRPISPDQKRKPGRFRPGFRTHYFNQLKRQAALLKVLVKLSLSGSAVSFATF